MRRFLRTLLFGDWLLKFFSLALAILTWVAVTFAHRQKPVDVPGMPDRSEQSYTDVPIRIVSGSDDVHELRTKPSEVDLVTVQGDKTIIQKLERQHIRIQVDLTKVNITNGMKQRINVITPAGVSSVAVRPEEVEIILPLPPEPKPEGQ